MVLFVEKVFLSLILKIVTEPVSPYIISKPTFYNIKGKSYTLDRSHSLKNC